MARMSLESLGVTTTTRAAFDSRKRTKKLSKHKSVADSYGTSSQRRRSYTQTSEHTKRRKMGLCTRRITLDPYIEVLEVGELFQGSGVAIPVIIKQLMRRYEFYYLIFGGDIYLPDATVNMLTIALKFFAGSSTGTDHVKAFDIFPKTEWEQWGKLSVVFGLTANLNFKVPLSAGGVPLPLVTEVSPQINAEFIAGPFEFSFRRAEILGAGKGNNIVNWQIRKGDMLRSGDFELYIILQTSKDLESVRTYAEMEAEVRRGIKKEYIIDEKDYQIALPKSNV